jgi:hypothetical protein
METDIFAYGKKILTLCIAALPQYQTDARIPIFACILVTLSRGYVAYVLGYCVVGFEACF